MQTNLKFSNLEFFTPIKKRRMARFVHALISMRGPKSNSDNYYLYLDGLKKSENLSWKYIKIGHDGSEIYITEGNEFNGYYINTNGAIGNKDLLENIFKLLKIEIPFVTGQCIKVLFTYKKVEDGMYLLKKI